MKKNEKDKIIVKAKCSKKDEVKKEDLEAKEDEDPNSVNLKHLFKFKCDLTDGR